MDENTEKKESEKAQDNQPTSTEKKVINAIAEAERVKKVADILRDVDTAVDEILKTSSPGCIAVLGLLVTSFFEAFRAKTEAVLMRDPQFREVSERVEREAAEKRKKEEGE